MLRVDEAVREMILVPTRMEGSRKWSWASGMLRKSLVLFAIKINTSDSDTDSAHCRVNTHKIQNKDTIQHLQTDKYLL